MLTQIWECAFNGQNDYCFPIFSKRIPKKDVVTDNILCTYETQTFLHNEDIFKKILIITIFQIQYEYHLLTSVCSSEVWWNSPI